MELEQKKQRLLDLGKQAKLTVQIDLECIRIESGYMGYRFPIYKDVDKIYDAVILILEKIVSRSCPIHLSAPEIEVYLKTDNGMQFISTTHINQPCLECGSIDPPNERYQQGSTDKVLCRSCLEKKKGFPLP